MAVGGGSARLTLPHLAKDDEGLYTIRIFTKDGTAEHSAYLFVSGTETIVIIGKSVFFIHYISLKSSKILHFLGPQMPLPL